MNSTNIATEAQFLQQKLKIILLNFVNSNINYHNFADN